jgi:hypothetical protein
LAEYRNDQLVGKWVHWDSEGRLIDVVGGENRQPSPQPQPKSASAGRAMDTSVE